MERGIKLSKINATFKQAFDLTPLLGKLQQHSSVSRDQNFKELKTPKREIKKWFASYFWWIG